MVSQGTEPEDIKEFVINFDFPKEVYYNGSSLVWKRSYLFKEQDYTCGHCKWGVVGKKNNAAVSSSYLFAPGVPFGLLYRTKVFTAAAYDWNYAVSKMYFKNIPSF